MRIKTYSEMMEHGTIEGRFEYLNLKGNVGSQTFGFDRWINQTFYRSRQWKDIRSQVILRDGGCDLAMPGYEIHDQILIHHINPMLPEDISEGDESILDPEFLITTTHRTHNAIHYGDISLLPRKHIARRPGDTKLW